MSNPRGQSTFFSQKFGTKTSSSNFQDIAQLSFGQGLINGAVITPFTFHLDRMVFLRHTQNNALRSDIKYSFVGRPLLGVVPTLLHNTARYGFAFQMRPLLKPLFDSVSSNQKMNQNYALGVGVGISTYVTAPLSVIKTMRYHGMPVTDILSMPLRDFFKGMFATSWRDGLYFSAYFTIQPALMKAAAPHCQCEKTLGATSGILAALATNPFAVISNHQKISPENPTILQTARAVHAKDGFKGFYRGFFGLTTLRMAALGAALESSRELLEIIMSSSPEI